MNYFDFIKKYINSEKNLMPNKSYLKYEKTSNLKKSFAKINVCVIYPNTYEIGMNNLGYLIACDVISSFKDVQVDRSFYYKKFNEIRGFLTGRKLIDFDVIVFSIPYELDVLNVNKVFELSGINEKNKPIVVSGGTSVMINPNIASNFSDIVLLGDAEILLSELFKFLTNSFDLENVYNEFLGKKGFYFPKFYENKNNQNNKNFILKQNVLKNIFYSPLVSPYTVFKNTVLIDGGRGCPYKCSFCVTGNFFKPVIDLDAMDFLPIVKNCVKKGVRNFGIISSFVGKIKNFSKFLNSVENVKINISSLRFEDINDELVKLLNKFGQKQITLAPEAGNEKLRKLILKNITNKYIIEKIKLIHSYKMSVKLYFIYALPNETNNDLLSIVELINELRKTGNIKASLQVFVPKPHTPLSTFEFENLSIIKNKKNYLIKKFREYKIPLNIIEFSSIKEAEKEYALSHSKNVNNLSFDL